MAGTISSSGAGSSGAGSVALTGTGGGGSGGAAASGDCALQGDYSANADMKVAQNTCHTLGGYKTIYDITVAQDAITIEQYVEKFPMHGTIDADRQAKIVVESPTYREFQLSFVPATLMASGTYIDADTSDCRTTYDATLVLMPK
jgi:hypothetical protein